MVKPKTRRSREEWKESEKVIEDALEGAISTLTKRQKQVEQELKEKEKQTDDEQNQMKQKDKEQQVEAERTDVKVEEEKKQAEKERRHQEEEKEKRKKMEEDLNQIQSVQNIDGKVVENCKPPEDLKTLKEESMSYISSQIQKNWTVFIDVEMLRARVEQAVTETDDEFRWLSSLLESEWGKCLEITVKIAILISKIYVKLDDVLKEYSMTQFQAIVETIVPEVLLCHQENFERQQSGIALESRSSVAHVNKIFLDIIDMSILLFILERKQEKLKQRLDNEENKVKAEIIELERRSSRENDTDLRQTLRYSPSRPQRTAENVETTTSTRSTRCHPRQQINDSIVNLEDGRRHRKSEETNCAMKTWIPILYVSCVLAFSLMMGFLIYIWTWY